MEDPGRVGLASNSKKQSPPSRKCSDILILEGFLHASVSHGHMQR